MTSSVTATKTITDLKLETKECKKYGYVLTGKFLGQGAYANVYLGHPTESKVRTNAKLRCAVRNEGKDLKVAIKIINIDSAPKVYITKFLPREIATMNKSYKHINVLQLYDMFATVKRVYLVLELASAGDLLTHINRCCAKSPSQSVPEESARKLFRGVASGLRFIHRRGIAHRDLKCENILLTKDFEIKLCDFGFAIEVNDSMDLLKTHCGSYAYASPEILRQQRYDGKMADLWSLGVVLFAMVNGGLPFKESDAKAVLEAMKKPVYFRTSLSSECKDLIRGLLRIKPQRRYTIDEVMKHPWITSLNSPECPLVVKVPCTREVNPQQDRTKPQSNVQSNELMSDPAAVSRYISNQIKIGRAEKYATQPAWRGHTIIKRVEKEPEAKKQSVNTESQSKVETKEEQRETPLVPKKIAISHYFKATIENLQSQMNESSPAQRMGLLVQKQNNRKKNRVDISKGLVPDRSEESPVKLQFIYDICRNSVAINSTVSKREGTPVPITPYKREMASPNVVNIRIDQVADLISSKAGDEHPNLKQKQNAATDLSKILDARKKTSKTNQKAAWKKETDKSIRDHSRNAECNQIAKVNIVHLNTSQMQCNSSKRKPASTAKARNIRIRDNVAGASKSSRLTTAWDTYQESNVRNEKNVTENGFPSRAFTTPCKNRKATSTKYLETRLCKPKTPTPQPTKECRRNSDNMPRLSRPNVKNKASNEEAYHREAFHDNHPTKATPSHAVHVQEGGELQRFQNTKEAIRSCSGTPTTTRHNRPTENPADAWELRPKTTAGTGECMEVNQILNYKIRQDRLTKAYKTTGRHSQQAMHYAYLVSADERRPQTHFSQRWSDAHKAFKDLSKAEYAGYFSAGNKILYRRASQSKQTMQTIQQLKKQARSAARSNRHFLPLPSCGVTGRNSSGRTKRDALSVPAERLYNSQTVVLRLNKT